MNRIRARRPLLAIEAVDPYPRFADSGSIASPLSLRVIARPVAGQGDFKMLIGKPGPAKTHICRAGADHIDVRGHDLTGDLMGRLSFTDYFFLLMTGRE